MSSAAHTTNNFIIFMNAGWLESWNPTASAAVAPPPPPKKFVKKFEPKKQIILVKDKGVQKRNARRKTRKDAKSK